MCYRLMRTGRGQRKCELARVFALVAMGWSQLNGLLHTTLGLYTTGNHSRVTPRSLFCRYADPRGPPAAVLIELVPAPHREAPACTVCDSSPSYCMKCYVQWRVYAGPNKMLPELFRPRAPAQCRKSAGGGCMPNVQFCQLQAPGPGYGSVQRQRSFRAISLLMASAARCLSVQGMVNSK